MAKIIISFVLIYRNTLGLVLPPSCRYCPTCSKYMIDSLKKHGALNGFLLGIKRIFRCHPWSKSDYWDPVK